MTRNSGRFLTGCGCLIIFWLLVPANFTLFAGDSSELVADNEAIKLTVEVKLLSPGEGSKYHWARLQVLKVIKNSSGKPVGNTVEAAYLLRNPDEAAYVFGNQIKLPSKEFIANLEMFENGFQFLGGFLPKEISEPK